MGKWAFISVLIFFSGSAAGVSHDVGALSVFWTKIEPERAAKAGCESSVLDASDDESTPSRAWTFPDFVGHQNGAADILDGRSVVTLKKAEGRRYANLMELSMESVAAAIAQIDPITSGLVACSNYSVHFQRGKVWGLSLRADDFAKVGARLLAAFPEVRFLKLSSPGDRPTWDWYLTRPELKQITHLELDHSLSASEAVNLDAYPLAQLESLRVWGIQLPLDFITKLMKSVRAGILKTFEVQEYSGAHVSEDHSFWASNPDIFNELHHLSLTISPNSFRRLMDLVSIRLISLEMPWAKNGDALFRLAAGQPRLSHLKHFGMPNSGITSHAPLANATFASSLHSIDLDQNSIDAREEYGPNYPNLWSVRMPEWSLW